MTTTPTHRPTSNQHPGVNPAPQPPSTPHPDTPPPPDPGEDPNHVVTTQEDQLKRSAEYEQTGVEAWKQAHDERKPEDRGRTVPGVHAPQEAPDPRHR